jgi:Ribonuclease G/E
VSQRQLYLDRGIGEDRGVVLLDGQPERLLIARDGAVPEAQVGARVAARVRKVEPAFASAFLDLGKGHEALLAFKPDSRPVEGAILEVEVRSEARDGKLATVRALGPGNGQLGLLQAAPGLAERLQSYSPQSDIIVGPLARKVADEAEEEALATLHTLPGGGSLAIEPTRALVAVDVDLGERKGQDAKRITRQTNMVALSAAARLLRLKGLGGLVVIDLVGRGHDGTALLAAARTAFAADNPGVAIGPVGKFGAMELSIPRRGRAIREILLDGQGSPTRLTHTLRVVRVAETMATQDRGARFVMSCSAEIASLAEPLVDRLTDRIGARVTLRPEADWTWDRFEVSAQ